MKTRRLRPANVVPEVVKSPSIVTRPIVRLAPRAVRLKVEVPSPKTTSRVCPPTSMVCWTAAPVVLARTITLAEASKPVTAVARVPLRKPAAPVPERTSAPVTPVTLTAPLVIETAPLAIPMTVTAGLPATALRWKTKEPERLPSDWTTRPPTGTVTATRTKEPAGRAAVPEPTFTVVATGRVLTSIRPDRSDRVSVDGSVKCRAVTSRAPAMPSAAMTRPPLMPLAETTPPRASAAPVTVTVVPAVSRCTQTAPVSVRPCIVSTTSVPPTRTLPAAVSTSAETVPVSVTPGTLRVTVPVMVPVTPVDATVRPSEAPVIVSAPPASVRLAPLTVIVVTPPLRVTATSPVSRWPRTSMTRPLPATRR